MRNSNVRKLFVVIAAAAAFAACSHAPTGPTIPQAPGTARHAGPYFVASDKIKHVVFIIQENRTFDSLFGGPGPKEGRLNGADAVAYGYTHDGTRIPLTGINIESPCVASCADPNNYHQQWLRACNAPYGSGPPFRIGGPSPCRMNGFDLNASPQPGYPVPDDVTTSVIYSYLNYNETLPYWDIARKYAVGDRFFMPHNSESYTAHQYLFSAQSGGTVDAPVYPEGTNCSWFFVGCAFTPWGCDSPPITKMFVLDPISGAEKPDPSYTSAPGDDAPLPCFGFLHPTAYESLAESLEKHQNQPGDHPWRVYAYNMCSSIIGLDANWRVRHTDWPPDSVLQVRMSNCHNFFLLNVIPHHLSTEHFVNPEYDFLTDELPSNPKDKKPLASVTYILPGPLSADHPGIPHGDWGPDWVASVVNAIGKSSDWNSTAIFILWDDWGGFYDHVPPYVVRDQAGPGFRVPLLVVSPYVRAHTVVHTNIEFGTLINFVEQTFGLGSLGDAADDHGPTLNNLNDFFNFNASPQPFDPITSTVRTPREFFRKADSTPHGKGVRARWLQLVGDPD
jgi:hypothetical protein